MGGGETAGLLYKDPGTPYGKPDEVKPALLAAKVLFDRTEAGLPPAGAGQSDSTKPI